ncbi:MAG: adenosylmethionine decarboxylase [Gammaproteobacteria bacterium]
MSNTMNDSNIQLHGFNNLTKTLSFNIYDVCYAHTDAQIHKYMDYIDEAYNAERLTQILKDVANIIGANILNIAETDYDPLGASVTILISEEAPALEGVTNSATPGPDPEAVVAHLDKSHLTAHTYPENHPRTGISTFRADIDVSTCGKISPLKALNFLIHSFESDIVIMDYRVRGFTRDTSGKKHYIDHEINSIQNFLDEETKARFQRVDVNIYEEKIFHSKMMLKTFELDDYLFGMDADNLNLDERLSIEARLKHEMQEIFYGRNIDERMFDPVAISSEND